MTPDELARALFEGGFAGAVLTNHFYGGNSGIDRSLSWAEFVRAYEKDYEDCMRAAKEYDLDILFGIEEHLFGGVEVLCYGITPKVLYDNPFLIERRPEDYARVVREAGGVIIQAHPYRTRSYITHPKPLPLEFIDGIEVYNYANSPECNAAAEEFAKAHPTLILTSGQDSHSPGTATVCGIEFYERVRDEKKLATLLKAGEFKLI